MNLVIPMLDTPHSGGTRALVELANGLIDRGHTCAFVVPKGTASIQFPTTAPTYEVGYYLPHLPNVRNFANAFLLGQFIPAADIVLANTWLSAFPVYWSLKKKPKDAQAFYFIQHDERLFFSNNPVGWTKRKLAHTSYRLPLRWLTNSVWLKERLHSEFHKAAQIINPGVDISVFSPGVSLSEKSNSVSVIAAVGRMQPIKGLYDLMEALEIVAAQQPIKLLVITQEYLSFAPSYPVEIVRPVSDTDIANAYRQADLFAFPSWLEGYGLPPLEAMACGVPVVTTDCGGIRDFAIDGENALIVPIRSPAKLAEAILKILNDVPLSQRLAQNGVQTAAKFTWDNFVDNAERIFLAALSLDGSTTR